MTFVLAVNDTGSLLDQLVIDAGPIQARVAQTWARIFLLLPQDFHRRSCRLATI